jgi:hypothetical protein
MLQRPIDPQEMLSLVEGEQCGIAVSEEKRREIAASPENRALYAELSASVRALRAMPLRDAPASVWTALDAAYDETFGAARERTAASKTTSKSSPTRIRSLTEARRRRAASVTAVVAAACLIAAGITIWSIARTGGDPNLAPNGLRFVETSVARVVDDLAAPAPGQAGGRTDLGIDRGRVIFSFLTKTQTLYQGVGALDLQSRASNGRAAGKTALKDVAPNRTVLSGIAPSAGN